MKRKIVQIHEDKCIGCELCVKACHEGAIEMVNGKAKLVSDMYCDGLGDCLPACPTDAIEIIEREADAYSQEAVDARMASKEKSESKTGRPHTGGCPGSKSMMLNVVSKKGTSESVVENTPEHLTEDPVKAQLQSKLSTWPVQINLVNPGAEYLDGADLLIAADCTAFAYGNFHNDFIKGRVTLIGCPKLDDNNYYIEKIGMILTQNNIKSITVVRMEVPCCSGIVSAVKKAMLNTETIVDYKEVIVRLDGSLK